MIDIYKNLQKPRISDTMYAQELEKRFKFSTVTILGPGQFRTQASATLFLKFIFSFFSYERRKGIHQTGMSGRDPKIGSKDSSTGSNRQLQCPSSGLRRIHPELSGARHVVRTNVRNSYVKI